LGTARPPLVRSRLGSARRMPRSRRHYSSRRKPKLRTLSPQCLNRQASKLLLKHPLGRSPNHTSTNPTNNKSNPRLGPHKVKHPLGRSPNHNVINPTNNKSNLFCQALKGGAGKNQPKQS
jgi:hypothetical protein